jgi:hypothetical protein
MSLAHMKAKMIGLLPDRAAGGVSTAVYRFRVNIGREVFARLHRHVRPIAFINTIAPYRHITMSVKGTLPRSLRAGAGSTGRGVSCLSPDRQLSRLSSFPSDPDPHTTCGTNTLAQPLDKIKMRRTIGSLHCACHPAV